MSQSIEQVIEVILGLYERFGNEDYIGEPVSQLEHMSQSAQLAIQAGSDDEIVLAAFFHDIGHLCAFNRPDLRMDQFGVKSHEKIGSDFLRQNGFPEKVAALVENHVQAKRYLTWKHVEYYHQLSDASKKTLDYQGGKMTEHEALMFERHPLFQPSIMLRKWDELAKRVATLHLQSLIAACISAGSSNAGELAAASQSNFSSKGSSAF